MRATTDSPGLQSRFARAASHHGLDRHTRSRGAAQPKLAIAGTERSEEQMVFEVSAAGEGRAAHRYGLCPAQP